MRIPDQSIQMQFRSVRRRFTARYRRSVGPIDVVALLNVILLLGMFQFTASRFVLQPGVRVSLPEAPFLDGALPGARVLTITQEGMFFFNDEHLTRAKLEAALAQTNGDDPLLIEADAGTGYGTLMDIYAMAQRAGIREVVLATRPPAVEP
ncbi:MAG: biopolymer transporter ExbD [Lentisphaerae bacterium]|jgi:biopolymer transport protein ExbD|nr:biopolymer transporter ExbD [Lentisphaerota bacterium]